MRYLILMVVLFLSPSLSGNPTQDKEDISEKKGEAKTLSDRCLSFMKGLGYTALGGASLFGTYQALHFAYKDVKCDYYELIRDLVVAPHEDIYPEYVAALNKARYETQRKPLTVAICLLFCGITGYINYRLKVPQNAAHHFKYAFK
jgi:hypothetical protein